MSAGYADLIDRFSSEQPTTSQPCLLEFVFGQMSPYLPNHSLIVLLPPSLRVVGSMSSDIGKRVAPRQTLHGPRWRSDPLNFKFIEAIEMDQGTFQLQDTQIQNSSPRAGPCSEIKSRDP